MSKIRSGHTKPELIVRRVVRSLGYGYRLHRRDLPGKPDLAFFGRRKAIFVHGCFWHQHADCREGRPPRSNSDYWTPKLQRNVQRDQVNIKALQDAGWQTLVIWECELGSEDQLRDRLGQFLG
jgi:DNA mismatch endonuclease, patch repair protein